MKKKYKKSWIKALRSGKFKQTYKVLCDYSDNSYCCLGVLCVISGVPKKFDLTSRNCSFDNDVSDLSPRLLKEFGMTRENMVDLIILNDVQKTSFKQIADFIERRL